ncbi:MAG: type IV pilus secretin PilQ [Gammaproteobacteria bacterium]
MKQIWTFLLGITILLISICVTSPAMAATLNSISSSVTSSQSVQVTLQFSAPVQKPKSFSTQQPPRVILDFFDVDKSIVSQNQTVNRGFLTSVSTISADGRTRVMLNLQQDARYNVVIQGNQVIVTLLSDASAISKPKTSIAVAPSYTKSTPSYYSSAAHYIKNVDFKRNNSGGGDVIIDLSDPNVVVNVNQENNTINVSLNNTTASGTLQRKLDVTDFATPVEFISTQTEGNQTQVQIQATGQFEQVAYQVNKQFIISVNPLSAEKKAQQAEQPTYTGKPISLNFQDIPIRSVLEVLAEFTGINIVASDDVKGNITLRLNNIPWDEALDIILKSSALGKKQVGDVIMVAPASVLATEEKNALTAKQDFQQLEPLQTQYIRLNYSKASDVASLLKGDSNTLLSPRGSVSVDTRTNTLIVQDTPSSLVNVQNLVAKLDIAVQQVMIEARIVNVDTSFEQDLGIRWGITRPQHVTGTLSGANQMLVNYQTGVVNPVSAVPLDQRLNVDLGAPDIAGVQTPSVGVALAELGNGYMLDLELSAIEQEGGGELISSPRLVTANQHPALIESGTEIPYQQATSSGATAVEFKKAVLSLKVTPQITPDGKIIMDIKVNQDKVNPTLQVQDVPAIDTREVETNVLVDNGETIVLGGIYEEDQRQTVNRVPFLGSIPLVGYLFRNSHKLNTRTELLIFITPKVIQQLPIDQ